MAIVTCYAIVQHSGALATTKAPKHLGCRLLKMVRLRRSFRLRTNSFTKGSVLLKMSMLGTFVASISFTYSTPAGTCRV